MKQILLFLLIGLSMGSSYAQTNIAYGSKVTVSSINSSPHKETPLMTDGVTTTRWVSDYADNQWIVIDLAGYFTISAIRINWHTDFANNYSVESSLNGDSWQPVITNYKGIGKIENLYITTNARFIRLLLHTRARTAGFSIWEIAVFGTTYSYQPPVIPEYKPSTTVDLKWSRPTARENGAPMAASEIGGYELKVVYLDGRNPVYIKIPATSTTYAFKTPADIIVSRLEIAVYDVNGLYSKFILFEKDITPPPKVRNLKLLKSF